MINKSQSEHEESAITLKADVRGMSVGFVFWSTAAMSLATRSPPQQAHRIIGCWGRDERTTYLRRRVLPGSGL
jgi:hypothetical protein